MPLQNICSHPTNEATCVSCQNCKTHCVCNVCNSCGFMFTPEEICLNCGFCGESCCRCIRCNGTCGKLLGGYDNEGSPRSHCRDCRKCFDCCKCFTCETCKVNFVSDKTAFCYTCGNCHVHCKEMLCSHGSTHPTPRLSYCESCNKCKEHCTCLVCSNCARKFPGIVAGTAMYREHFHTTDEGTGAPPCMGCRYCCRCRVVGVELRKGKFQLFHSVFSKGQFKRNPLRRHLSVEMEVDRTNTAKYSTKVNAALTKWQDPVVHDGSLEAGGFEINTNPCNGDLFLDHIKDLCDGLEDINAGCTASCGIHVHVNVKGTPLVKEDGSPILRNGEMVYDQRSAYTHYDLRRLILLYYFLEPAIYGLCAPQRLSSRYAKPCGQFYLSKNKSPKDFRKDAVVKLYREGKPLPNGYVPGTPRPKVEKVKTLLKYDDYGEPVYIMVPKKPKTTFKSIGREITATKKEKYHKIRYNSLNLHSFFMRGTIEFRHKEGSVSYNEITNWALICGQIVEAAAKMTEAQIRALPRNPREALLAVLTPELQQYAQRKWEVQDAEQPRFRQMIEEQWQGKINYEV